MNIARAAGLALLLAAPARAAFLDLGAGARAPGMGDAFTALADDAYAIHYNPAGLAQLDRSQFSASYSKLYLGLSDGSDLGSSQLMYAKPLANGRNGTLGFGWDRFSLSGLYTEQTLSVSYGRRLMTRDSGAQLMGGLNLKYLTHSFSAGSEAGNALDLGASQGVADPVLSGKSSKSTPDVDMGFIYRFPRRFQVGLDIMHFTQPNVAFSGSDKLQREINLGVAYKSLWLSLMGELKSVPSATGGTDRDMIFAAERYFPTLDYGQFGLRGSLGLAMNDPNWKQITLGASYRINKIQFDYAFILPVGGIQTSAGSQRVSLTFHFGAPTGDEEISRELLEQARHLREHGPDYGYEYAEELKPQDLNDPRLAEVRHLIEKREYRSAQKALNAFALKQPLSQGLLRLSNRLGLVIYYYGELPEPKDKYDKTLVESLRKFFYGQDRLAVLQASYAFSMKPEDARLGHLLEDMEKAVKLPATRLGADHPRSFIEEMLYQAEFANTRGEMTRVETLLADTLVLEPENATALERLGSMRYTSGRLADAIAAWDAAVKVETRQAEVESLREYLRVARERAGSKTSVPGPLITVPAEVPAPAGQAAPAATSPATAPATAPATSPATAPATAPAAAAGPASPATVTIPAPVVPRAPAAGDPRDVESLYQRGVEHYARGEYLEASAMFLRILQIDPSNEQATKALARIQRMRPGQ
jgi:tetratricopeptide (TPR) repeat protein